MKNEIEHTQHFKDHNDAERTRKRIGEIHSNQEPHEPKTPHEELMFVVESTNDIVSEILAFIEWKFPVTYHEFKEKTRR